MTSVFVPGKVSKAKCLIADAVCLVQNRGSLQAINSNSYGMEKLTITFNVLIIIIIIISIICCLFGFLSYFFSLTVKSSLGLCLYGIYVAFLYVL